MLGKHWTLFKLFGFEVKLDASWLLLAVLVTWSLADGVFPQFYEGLTPRTYWSMGLAGMVGLVFSIIFHEISHALVARHRGLSIGGITLFVFGGVAELAEEPRTPATEFLMAIAGPLASGLLALMFFALASLLVMLDFPEPLQGVAYYLAGINALLAAFNLIPAFPLDGGRILRAALWYWKGDLRWATRRAVRNGEILAFALMFLGVLNIVTGNFIGGMWWFLIGLFLLQAAKASFIQMWTRQAFEGEPVSRFMTTDLVTVPDSITITEFVRSYVYTYHYDLFPVTCEGRLVGSVSIHDVKRVSADAWDRHFLSTILRPCTDDNTTAPQSDALHALAQMRRTGNSRLLVVDHGRLVGVIALKDMLELIALRVDLEGLG